MTQLLAQVDILRRIAERGMDRYWVVAQYDLIDFWQHMLDEIERLKKNIENNKSS